MVPPPPAGTWPRIRIRLRRHRIAVALGLVVAVVVAGAAYRLSERDNTCGHSGSGVRRIDGECVGVTDGSFAFDDAYTGIQRKIAAENAAVSGSGNTVTIALLDPLTVDATSANTPAMILNELEGAYTAQMRINRTAAIDDPRPLVKVVLANWGSHELQWKPVVEQLEGMVDDPEPLVAVAGLRLSTVHTESAAKHLAEHNIPIISSIATADQLNYGAIRGFVRSAPPNTEYVEALYTYARNNPELDSAMLVYDSNSDVNDDPGTTSGADLFTRSLREDLEQRFADLNKYRSQSYQGVSGPKASSPSLFTNVVHNICGTEPKVEVVLYAGRVVDFNNFLQAMYARVCVDTPVTVLGASGDFGALQLRSQEKDLREKNIRIAYATETDPQGWRQNAKDTPKHFGEFLDMFRRLGFDEAHLDDGGAISTHDALLIAAKAARLSARAQPGEQPPTHEDVLNQLLNLNIQNKVPAASGDLEFSFRGADSGNPSNKPIPVIEVPSNAPAQTIDVHYTK
ncbi:ABC transporter substrate-binding protein [Nocardia sp. BMG51109]|uniref:ABC transporter substrate-binding protein n=1 Tax=Nocardia sp. BMG51109 TaxID=1056816 RepID=UPI000467C6FA|nr:ABC transporter substrate-binding protein [Nocardia sp. BMG51109]